MPPAAVTVEPADDYPGQELAIDVHALDEPTLAVWVGRILKAIDGIAVAVPWEEYAG